jgi:hypothetical protein
MSLDLGIRQAPLHISELLNHQALVFVPKIPSERELHTSGPRLWRQAYRWVRSTRYGSGVFQKLATLGTWNATRERLKILFAVLTGDDYFFLACLRPCRADDLERPTLLHIRF